MTHHVTGASVDGQGWPSLARPLAWCRAPSQCRRTSGIVPCPDLPAPTRRGDGWGPDGGRTGRASDSTRMRPRRRPSRAGSRRRPHHVRRSRAPPRRDRAGRAPLPVDAGSFLRRAPPARRIAAPSSVRAHPGPMKPTIRRMVRRSGTPSPRAAFASVGTLADRCGGRRWRARLGRANDDSERCCADVGPDRSTGPTA
jgi:hypothetical protein